MGKAAYQTEQAMKQMSRDAKIVGAALGALGVVGAGAMAIMVKQSIDAADKLRDMSQKTAIAVETLNGMGFAASQAGGSLDGMVSAAGKLNKSIAEGAQGNNDQAAAFKALGINVVDISGKLKTADVVMTEMASKFATFSDGPEKVALSMALMGKAGADMIPVLNEGGEAMRVNIEYSKQYSGMTTELANGADNFNDTMGKLQLQQQGFANTLTAAVLPILQAVADETLRAAEESNGFTVAANAARTVLETFVVVGSEVAFVFKGVGTEIGGMAAQLAALARGDMKGFTAISDAMKEDAARARVEHDKFVTGIMNRTPATVDSWGNEGRRAGTPTLGAAPRIPGSGKSLKDAAAKQAKLIEDGKNLANGLIAQDSGLSPDFMKKWESLSLAYGSAAISLEKLELAQSQLLSQQPLMKAMNDEAIKADIDGFKAMEDLRKAAEDDARRNELNVQAIAVGLMSEAEQQAYGHGLILRELGIFHDTKLENVALANLLIEQENARHQQTLADMQANYDLQTLGMIGDSADQLLGILKKSGQDQTALGKAVFLATKAIAVAEIIMNTERAASAALAATGIFGIPVATMIRATGYASAGMVAGMAIAEVSGQREKGGQVWPGGAFIVGEKGPEIFKPTGTGTIIPNSQISGGTGSAPMALTIVNQTSGRIDKVTEQRISPTERAIIIQEAVNSTAAQLSDPNSKTSRAMSRNYATQRSR